jgi:hypothetical protein
LEEKNGKVDMLNTRLNNINTLLDKYNTIMTTGRSINTKYKRAKAIKLLRDNLEPIQVLNEEIRTIKGLYTSHSLALQQENEMSKKISYLESLTSHNIISKIDKFKKKWQTIDEISILLELSNKYKIQYNTLSSKYKEWADKINAAQKEYDDLAKDMKEQGLWCDVCDRPLAIEKEHKCLTL